VLSRSARTSSLAMALVTVWMSAGIEPSFAQQLARCEVDKARFAIGQPYSPELAERAGRAAGARSTRKLEPGMPATTDLREDRLNLQVDGQGIVDRLTCG
jgi:Peptidase inhibitor I78 family